ncbi:PREDICTED: transcription intermediary factor 1-beta, partial [Ficedula albicollis]|uniref:transcription intermediary factor 1-beta n=1 Tax=Ficedula albicollis TaxID=59894 RepID=UPI0007AD90BE
NLSEVTPVVMVALFGVFDCPVCHQQCPLGDIMENFFLQDSGASSGQSCTSCEDNAAATSFCLECAEPLCDTCVEAHQRVRYTRDHTVRALGVPGPCPGPCPAHPSEPLALFCSACDALTCRACHLGSHRDHPSQPLEDAVCRQRSVLSALLQRLGDKHAALQRSTRELRAVWVSPCAPRVPTGVPVSPLCAPRQWCVPVCGAGCDSAVPVCGAGWQPCPRCAAVAPCDTAWRCVALLSPQRVSDARQQRLQCQHRALSRAQRQQEHVLRFTARALDSPHGAALLLSRRLIHSQLLRALRVTVEPLELQGDLKFQWDRLAWTRSAESFGEGHRGTVRGHPGDTRWTRRAQGTAGTGVSCDNGQQGSGRGVTRDRRGEDRGDKGQDVPGKVTRDKRFGGVTRDRESLFGGGDTGRGHREGTAAAPLTCLSPATSPPENGVTAVRRRKPGNSPKEEKFVKKLFIKRRGPPEPQPGPRLPKVPRVRLERLQLDLELDPAQPPVFRIFPGPSAREFSVIVIERGTAGTEGTEGTAGTAGTAGTEGTEGTAGTVQPHRALPVKEEQQESPIGDTGDTKPVGLLPPPPGELGPAPGSSPGPGLPVLPVGLPVLPVELPVGVSCCRVCGQAGAVVMCDRCQRCFHLHCHLPALQDVPSPEWTCLLCQELPPPSPDTEQGTLLKLSPQDQQRCEFVLLELLCHEPCRPLHRLSSCPDGRDAIDLTLMRARLQEKLSPHYRSPEEFARDGWQLLRQFHRLTEDKADVQSILGLQRFLESRLNAVFGDQKFSRLLLDPEDSLEMFPGS